MQTTKQSVARFNAELVDETKSSWLRCRICEPATSSISTADVLKSPNNQTFSTNLMTIRAACTP